MLVTSETNSGPPSRTPSILDSPTLARVERARLRLEAANSNGTGNGNVENSLERKILDPKVSEPFSSIPITNPINQPSHWLLYMTSAYRLRVVSLLLLFVSRPNGFMHDAIAPKVDYGYWVSGR